MPEARSVPELVHAAVEGDQSAWNEIVERYLPLVTSVLGKYRLGDEDAQDVSQTVWLRLVEHLGDIREPRAMPAWIVTTTRNEALRVLATRRRSVSMDPQIGSVLDSAVNRHGVGRNSRAWSGVATSDAPEDAGSGRAGAFAGSNLGVGGAGGTGGGGYGDMDDQLLREERAQALREGLTELKPHHRELLLLLLDDPPLPYERISARLGISVGSIGPTRARALEQLRGTCALSGLLATHNDREYHR